MGYAIWCAAFPFLRATTAATVQLCVPVIAALRLLLASVAILGGIGLVMGVSSAGAAGEERT